MRSDGGNSLYMPSRSSTWLTQPLSSLRRHIIETSMTSLRKRKPIVCQAIRTRNRLSRLEDLAWDQIPAVGREFGSPDFDRLMEEDFRDQTGVFDPNLKSLFPREAGSSQ